MKQTITFQKDIDGFYSTLIERVLIYLKSQNIEKYGGAKLIIKNLFLACIFISIYITALHFESTSYLLIAFSLLGPLSIILAINIVHDAIHEVAHHNKRINNLLIYQLDILGPNSYMWKVRHKFGHHSFPNILDHDPDLKQSNLARIFPNAKKLWIHRYQHFYVPLLYAFYTLNMVFVRDFTDFFSQKSEFKPSAKIEYFKLIIFKMCYLIIFIAIPIYLASFHYSIVLFAFLLMHVCASYFLTIALVPSHVSDQSVFPLPDDHGVIAHSWAHHQVLTTIDFDTKNKVLTWLLGGFNHHVTHHLFPTISHMHYPKITPIVRNTILEFGLPYKEVDSLTSAYFAHFKLLQKNALEL